MIYYISSISSAAQYRATTTSFIEIRQHQAPTVVWPIIRRQLYAMIASLFPGSSRDKPPTEQHKFFRRSQQCQCKKEAARQRGGHHACESTQQGTSQFQMIYLERGTNNEAQILGIQCRGSRGASDSLILLKHATIAQHEMKCHDVLTAPNQPTLSLNPETMRSEFEGHKRALTQTPRFVSFHLTLPRVHYATEGWGIHMGSFAC